MLISRRTKNIKRRRNNKLNPILKGGKSQKNITADSLEKQQHQPEETASINSRVKMTHTASAFFRSTDSVPTITVPANASTVGSFTSSTKQAYYYNQSMIPPLENEAVQSSNPFSPTTANDSIHNRPSTSSTLTPPQENGRSLMHWNDELVDEEVQRRKLGEALLQRQLEEDGTSVKHAGRFTRVKSLADIQKSAIIEQS
ncbi:MAG: hypothetical protein EXX96DRAFT_583057 [Benjaminiella poitrasii]|nr:MAG: hypothetical protein EXX96DRAFT_583057 [Benjaminiella poitrasii]